MDFIVPFDKFQKTIKALTGIVGFKAGNAANMMGIRIQDNQLLLSITTPEIILNASIDSIDAKEDGIFFIDFTQIRSFIFSFTPWNEEEKKGAKHIRIKSTSSINKIQLSINNYISETKKSVGKITLPLTTTKFIKLDFQENAYDIILSSVIFKEIYSRVNLAIDINSSQPALRGINVGVSEGKLFFASTNGVMVAEYELKSLSKAFIDDKSYIVPFSFFTALRKTLINDYNVNFKFFDNYVIGVVDNVIIRSNLIIGATFPDYKPLFSKFIYEFTLDKNMVIERLLSFKDVLNKDDSYRLSLIFKQGKFTLANELLSFEDLMDVEFDKDVTIDINGNIFLQALSTIKDDSIAIKLTNEISPLILDSLNFTNQKTVLLPIRRRR